MTQHVSRKALPSYLVRGRERLPLLRKVLTWGLPDRRKSVPQAVQSLGLGDSGWSQGSRVVPGKAVLFPLFPAGSTPLASDCRSETSWGRRPGFTWDAHWCFSEEPKFLPAGGWVGGGLAHQHGMYGCSELRTLRPCEGRTNESFRANRAALRHHRCTFTELNQTNAFTSCGSNTAEELEGIQCPLTVVTTNVSAQCLVKYLPRLKHSVNACPSAPSGAPRCY